MHNTDLDDTFTDCS